MRSLAFLALFVLLSFGAAALGAFSPPGEWYAELIKPTWTPPNWIFGPVWTVLYLMIAVSGWLLWKEGAKGRKALILWGVQLALNAAWTPVFFGLEAPVAALLVIGMLLVAILATIVAAWRVRRSAAALLMPYAAWVTFATALNAAISQLN